MSEKPNKIIKGLKKGLGGVRLRIQGAKPLRSRSLLPSLSAGKVSGTANDLDISRTTPVSLNRNRQAEAMERGSLPSRPRENSEASSSQPRFTTPSQTAIPSIMINNGQAVEIGKVSGLTENRGPQSPNQEWVSLLPPLLVLSWN